MVLKSASRGFTLAEILLAIPLLLVTTMSLAYFGSIYSFSNAQTIGRFRCQTAVHNLLTLVQAASTTAPLTVVSRHTEGGGTSGTLLTSSPAHPDGSSALTVSSSVSTVDGYGATLGGAAAIPLHVAVTDDSTGARSEIITYVPAR